MFLSFQMYTRHLGAPLSLTQSIPVVKDIYTEVAHISLLSVGQLKL